jgi:hypothetical protein
MEFFFNNIIINILIYVTYKFEISLMNYNTQNEIWNNCNHVGEVKIKKLMAPR